jgi:transcriptional regulator with XRE-family HTH domain
MKKPKRRRKGINVELGLRLRNVRLENGLTQAEVAAHLRMLRSSYVNLEFGRQNVTLDVISRCASLYAMTVSELLEGVAA